jgi:hypothetical protein
MASPHMVPPVRGGLLTSTGKKGATIIEDPVQRIRVPADTLTVRIMDVLMEGPIDPDGLIARVGAARVEVRRRVALLNRYALLTTPRGAQQEEVHTQAQALWSEEALQEAPSAPKMLRAWSLWTGSPICQMRWGGKRGYSRWRCRPVRPSP